MPDVDEIADELYGLAPEEFTGARDAASRAATHPAVKGAIKSLRKPTAAAHEVNQLVRDRPADIDALLRLGDALRETMSGDPSDVRRLSEQRRGLIADLISPDLSPAVQQDVTATLEAATADPDLGAAVRSGRLVKPLRYAGLGVYPDLADAVATPLRRPKPATAKTATATAAATKTSDGSPKPKQKAPAKAPAPQPDLGPLRERVLELAGVADDAQRRYDAAARAVVEARKLLEAAEAERTEAHKAARAAHAEAEQARRELGRRERQ